MKKFRLYREFFGHSRSCFFFTDRPIDEPDPGSNDPSWLIRFDNAFQSWYCGRWSTNGTGYVACMDMLDQFLALLPPEKAARVMANAIRERRG